MLKESGTSSLAKTDFTLQPIVSKKPSPSVLRVLHVRLKQYQAPRERIFEVANFAKSILAANNAQQS